MMTTGMQPCRLASSTRDDQPSPEQQDKVELDGILQNDPAASAPPMTILPVHQKHALAMM